MACDSDYKKMANNAVRRQTALKELIAGGVNKHKAMSIIAISATESSFIWNEERSDKLPFAKTVCWQCRAVIGWEYSLFEGKRVLHAANHEKVAAQYLLDNKLAYWGAGQRLYPNAGLNTADGDAMAAWFEWALMNRRSDLLPNWSIGPTQMHLLWSDLYLPHRKSWTPPSNGSRRCWLQTWEELFSFYMLNSAAARAHAITYLDPGKCNMGAKIYPSEQPANRNLAIAWLVEQIGNPTAAATYYDNHYKGNLAAVMTDAVNLKLA